MMREVGFDSGTVHMTTCPSVFQYVTSARGVMACSIYSDVIFEGYLGDDRAAAPVKNSPAIVF
jgi:hypothetical protein